MENSAPRPDTINALRFGTDASFAMLAGMQLDVFTPLSNGSLTAEQIANAIGVAPTRLPLLLYALVAAGLLTEQDGQFANTPEAQHFLVKDSPSYMGNVHALLLNQWERKLKTAASLRTGIPQAYVYRTRKLFTRWWIRAYDGSKAGIAKDKCDVLPDSPVVRQNLPVNEGLSCRN